MEPTERKKHEFLEDMYFGADAVVNEKSGFMHVTPKSGTHPYFLRKPTWTRMLSEGILKHTFNNKYILTKKGIKKVEKGYPNAYRPFVRNGNRYVPVSQHWLEEGATCEVLIQNNRFVAYVRTPEGEGKYGIMRVQRPAAMNDAIRLAASLGVYRVDDLVELE